MTPVIHKLFYQPSEAAEMLGITVGQLIAIVAAGHHAFTSLSASASPHAGPIGRGRRWGLTASQLHTILEARARIVADDDRSEATRPLPAGHDGKRRLDGRRRGHVKSRSAR